MMLKWFSTAGLIGAALSGTALAADLPYRRGAPVPVPIPVPAAFTWTGFYLGVNVGGAVSDPDFTLRPGPTFGSAAPAFANARITRDRTSVMGGVQTGYNYQIGSFVFGEESDVNLLNLSDRGAASTAAGAPFAAGTTFNANLRSRVDGLSTHRLRVGFTPFERLLIYGTAGVAAAEIRNLSSVTINGGGAAVPTFFGRDSTYRAGFVAGGGVEYALSNSVSLKGEYLHVDLGRESFATVGLPGSPTAFAFQNRVRTSFDIGRVGLNVRFDTVSTLVPSLTGLIGLPAIPMKATPGARDWTGFYVGAFGGAVGDDSRLTTGPGVALSLPGNGALAAATTQQLRGRRTSGIGGIEAGYDKQFGSLVLGTEADIGWLDLSERRAVASSAGGTTVTGTLRRSVDDVATFRTRIGFSLFDNLLVYGTGGLAVADIRNSVNLNLRTTLGASGNLGGEKSTFRAGSAYGGGIEYAVTPNLSLKAEYLRVDIRHQNFVVQPDGISGATAGIQLPARDSSKFDIGRIGVNYRFASPDHFLGFF